MIDRCMQMSRLVMPPDCEDKYDVCSCIIHLNFSSDTPAILELSEDGQPPISRRLDNQKPLTISGRETFHMTRTFILNPSKSCYLVTFRRIKVKRLIPGLMSYHVKARTGIQASRVCATSVQPSETTQQRQDKILESTLLLVREVSCHQLSLFSEFKAFPKKQQSRVYISTHVTK